MSLQRQRWLDAVTLQGAGVTEWFDVSLIDSLTVTVSFDGDGDPENLGIWLQGATDESGVGAFDVPADQMLISQSTIRVDQTGLVRRRNIADQGSDGPALLSGLYRHVPFRKARLAWKASGPGQWTNVNAYVVGK